MKFLNFLVEYKNSNIKKDKYEGLLMLTFGMNHQTLASAKKVFDKTKIIVENQKAPAYLQIDSEKLKEWVLLMRELYWDWNGWKMFKFLKEES